jgi:NlpC/P60 family putative phage cell wall peptidase
MKRDDIRQEIVAAARAWIGTPYRHQASLQGVGCDCLGLLRGVWRNVYGAEPERPPGYARDWAEAGGDEPLLAAARRHLVELAVDEAAAGDVLVFCYRPSTSAKHVAILATPTTMIHAAEGASVAEVALLPWWRRRIAAAFAFPYRD